MAHIVSVWLRVRMRVTGKAKSLKNPALDRMTGFMHAYKLILPDTICLTGFLRRRGQQTVDACLVIRPISRITVVPSNIRSSLQKNGNDGV